MKLFFSFPQPQVMATFLGRPQRFLVEARLADGSKTLVYCANPGSFKDCLKVGSPILLWDSSDATRKKRYTWRAIKLGRCWVGTDTHLANRLVEKAFLEKRLSGFEGYVLSQREPRDAKGGKLDFHLTGASGECFVEVKSATVVSGDCARFPDSKTPRGIRHLNQLKAKAKAGHRAILIFLVQRGDVQKFALNRDCDPAFNRAFDQALAAGVEVLAVKHNVTQRGFSSPLPMPVGIEKMGNLSIRLKSKCHV